MQRELQARNSQKVHHSYARYRQWLIDTDGEEPESVPESNSKKIRAAENDNGVKTRKGSRTTGGNQEVAGANFDPAKLVQRHTPSTRRDDIQELPLAKERGKKRAPKAETILNSDSDNDPPPPKRKKVIVKEPVKEHRDHRETMDVNVAASKP